MPFGQLNVAIQIYNICKGRLGSRGGKGVLGLGQGCGNTMPDLSDLVPFHSGQVESFYLLVLGQVQVY